MLSNDLDEYTIKSILDEGAPVTSWGVGTKLATAYEQPTLGGVFKLSAVRQKGQAQWTRRLKISETAAKLTTPGVLDVRRYYHDSGRLAGDMVFDVTSGVDGREVIIDPADDLRQKKLSGLRFETLLKPLARNGKSVLDGLGTSALAAQARAKEGLACLDESQLRMLNPPHLSGGAGLQIVRGSPFFGFRAAGCGTVMFLGWRAGGYGSRVAAEARKRLQALFV